MKRIALIGLGAAARQIHVPACAGLPGARIVAGCDPAAVAGAWPFPVYDALDLLFGRHDCDIAIVATPPESHATIVAACLERGWHVLCEKPFAPTLGEALALVRLADARRRKLAVNNEFRFMRCHAAARAQIGTQAFGELLFVQVDQTFRMSPGSEADWRAADRERTCKEFGTHVFDLCRFFYGAEPTRLYARMPGAAARGDLLDLIDLRFPGDRWARITLDRLTRGRHRYLDIRLDGSAGSVETHLGGRLAMGVGVQAATRRPYIDAELSLGGRAYLYHGERRHRLAADPLALFAGATRELLRQFIAAIDADARPPCDGRDNLRTLALMRAAYEAAAGSGEADLAFLDDLP